MLKNILLISAPLFIGLSLSAQTTHNVTINNGSYVPAEKVIQVGDKINFSANSAHPLREVEKATWDAGDVTLKSGGFNCQSNCLVSFDIPGDYYYVCVAHAQFGMKGKIVVQSPLNIGEEVISAGNYKVYPNPAENVVNVKFNASSKGTISVLNSLGSEVYSTEVNNVQELAINVQHFEAGLYHLVVNQDNKRTVSRFLKK